MTPSSPWPFVLVLVVAWSLAGVMSPAAMSDRAEGEELLYYPSGKMLEQAALGYHHAAASLTWLRTVQYYGEHVRGDQQFEMMYHLCDVVTDLDPQFIRPYTFGSYVLHTEGRAAEKGLELLAKGRRNNPESWEVLFESGFVEYIAWKRYDLASDYFTRAAAMPDAPEYASRFAAFVSAKAGEIETSILLWQELAERSENAEIREKAIRKVEELKTQLAEQRARESKES